MLRYLRNDHSEISRRSQYAHQDCRIKSTIMTAHKLCTQYLFGLERNSAEARMMCESANAMINETMTIIYSKNVIDIPPKPLY